MAVERLQSIYFELKEAAVAAENRLNGSDGTRELIHSIVGLVNSLTRYAQNQFARYRNRLTDITWTNDVSGFDYPHQTLLVRYRTIPFPQLRVGAEYYNAAILAGFSILALVLARIVLFWATRTE
jgi:hypothetical protein